MKKDTLVELHRLMSELETSAIYKQGKCTGLKNKIIDLFNRAYDDSLMYAMGYEDGQEWK
jgi:hypothetical protein